MNCRNHKFRLYPTALQEQQLESTIDGCRWIYNYLIDKRLSREDMQFARTELQEQEPFLRNYHSKMLQMVCHKVDTANKALRSLRKNGHRIGRLRIRLHRQVSNIKQITIKHEGRKWYAIVCCEIAKPIFNLVDMKKSVGIDVGITKFCHDSDNHEVENPQFLRKMIRPLRRASRRLSRRRRGSQNYERAKSRLQILHERIRNKRHDFLHRQSKWYSDRYDLIFLERLRVLNMTKNHKFARAILDSGWSTFGRMLAYKAKKVVGVLAANTTVDCCRCGGKVPKTLAVRIHRCEHCYIVLDRDYNAAVNILLQ